jgi:2-keto-4-pentenoate hydratase
VALWGAWQSGDILPGLPADIRPSTINEGYAIQAELGHLAGPRVGWKIAATGSGGQTALGVDHPLAGPLFQQFLVRDGGQVDFAPVRMRTVEAEFGFLISRDLPAAEAPFDREAVLASLAAFVPAIEIPNTRFDDHRAAGGPSLVADAACAGFYALGPAVTGYDPRTLPSALVTITTSSGVAEGTGSNVLGDPVEAVRWLANELASYGLELCEGDAVITGSAVAIRDPGSGDVVADFGVLGSVSVVLS